MTIGAWVVVVVIGLIGFGIALFVFLAGLEDESRGLMTGGIVVFVITAVVLGVFIWYRCNSESGKRALKDQQSNLNGGINRVVSVYDISGDLIAQYSGNFDVETDKKSYILFDDEKGKRHIIYYTTGTVIIDEK